MKHQTDVQTSIQRKRATVATIDILIMLFSGLVYSWSLFVAPLESEFGWTRSQTSMVFTLCSVSNTIFALVSAILARKLSSKRVMQICAIIGFLGFFGVSCTQHLWQIYICYSLLGGIAIGSAYNQTLSTIVLWFRDKASLMTGILLMCYGMGSVILSPIISYLISNVGWRNTFIIFAIIAFIILFLTSFQTISPTREIEAFLPPAPVIHTNSFDSDSFSQDYMPGEMIRTKSFWFFLIWNLSIGLIGLTLSSHAAPIVQSIGVTAGISSLFVSCFSLCNGLGRVSFGIIFDRIGRKRSTLLTSIIGLFAGFLLLFAYQNNNAFLLFLSFLALGFSFGGGPVCSASIMKELFGSKNYGLNLGFGNLAILGSAFAGPYVSGMLYQNWGYTAVSIFLIAIAATSLFFAVLLAICKKI